MSKKIKKKVKFGYFLPALIFDEKKIDRRIEKFEKNLKKAKKEDKLKYNEIKKSLDSFYNLKNIANNNCIFDLRLLLNKANNNILNRSHEIDNKIIDIDIDTYNDDEKYVFFQMANNREDFITKKKVCGEKEPIILEDDEYIGEYVNILYSVQCKIIMLQKNKYSVSSKQLESFLTRMWCENFCKENNYNDKGVDNELPIKVILNQIMNTEKLKELEKCNTFESIKVACNSIALKEILKDSKPNKIFVDLEKILNKTHGYKCIFEIKVDVRKDKDKKLNEEEVINIIKSGYCVRDVNDINCDSKSDDGFDITTKYRDPNTNLQEALTWSTPFLTRIIEFEYDKREELSANSIYQKMLCCFELDKNSLK